MPNPRQKRNCCLWVTSSLATAAMTIFGMFGANRVVTWLSEGRVGDRSTTAFAVTSGIAAASLPNQVINYKHLLDRYFEEDLTGWQMVAKPFLPSQDNFVALMRTAGWAMPTVMLLWEAGAASNVGIAVVASLAIPMHIYQCASVRAPYVKPEVLQNLSDCKAVMTTGIGMFTSFCSNFNHWSGFLNLLKLTPYLALPAYINSFKHRPGENETKFTTRVIAGVITSLLYLIVLSINGLAHKKHWINLLNSHVDKYNASLAEGEHTWTNKLCNLLKVVSDIFAQLFRSMNFAGSFANFIKNDIAVLPKPSYPLPLIVVTGTILLFYGASLMALLTSHKTEPKRDPLLGDSANDSATETFDGEIITGTPYVFMPDSLLCSTPSLPVLQEF